MTQLIISRVKTVTNDAAQQIKTQYPNTYRCQSLLLADQCT